MTKQVQNYKQMLPEFRRNASLLLVDNLPEHAKVANELMNASLRKNQMKFRGWFTALKFGLITIDDFIRLFKALRAFRLKDLKKRGISDNCTLEIEQILSKLFRAMMIVSSGAAEKEFDENIINL